MAEIHGCQSDSSDDALRNQYSEFLPVDEVSEKKARRYPLNPDRVKAKSEFNSDRHEAAFAEQEVNGMLLHNEARPSVIIDKEKPEHRFLIFLFAQGMSVKDVFCQLGGEWDKELSRPVSGTGQYSYQHLITIRRQSWFQSKLIQYMEELGKSAVQARLELEVMPSIERIAKLRDDPDAPKAVQLNASNSLLDRFLGKPQQSVQVVPVSNVARYEQDAEKLQQEVEKIEAEIRNLNPAVLTNIQ